MNTTELSWFKSSYSDGEGGACIEVAYDWRKSSYSGAEGGECVEVAAHPSAIHIRDSKNTPGPEITVLPTAWAAFVSYATR
ncbi:DUF397 domain-containing protein [Streptomyces sp. TLI_146]|uniref:DUF397 domain-containing protein n=1 Tax=Streptomyces sp. TLI_146 TaxID=1938858 RepID=UPI000C70F615|nr:DUF397 domain-containing protein [Streptomyces sp. TLI_146]PKV87172.1 uncharacterized protein DUF397 [Streptomyces sp. TLI_146]